MHFEYAYAMEEELLAGLLSGLITGIPSSLLSILVYVFSSLSLYTIAKRRGLANPWLSWIPVGNLWILGSISDQYRYVVKGEDRSKRKILLVLGFITAVLAVVAVVLVTVMTVNIVNSAMSGRSGERILREVMGSLGGMLLLVLPVVGVSIASAVLRYMALYDLYASCEPQNKTIYLVVGILVNITEPVFLFLCRNKDLGMPPRRVVPSYQSPQDGWQPDQQNYQNPQY